MLSKFWLMTKQFTLSFKGVLYGNLADPFDGQRTVLQQFGILFMNFNFACYALSTK